MKAAVAGLASLILLTGCVGGTSEPAAGSATTATTGTTTATTTSAELTYEPPSLDTIHPPQTLAFGDTYTYPSGLAVRLAQPRRGVNHTDLIVLTYTLTNGTAATLTSSDYAAGFHTFADVGGQPVPIEIVPGVDTLSFPSVILPGESGTQELPYRAAPGLALDAGWNQDGVRAIYVGVTP